MAVTENTYTGNGSTTSYSLTFQYIDEDDIKVSLNGTDTTAYTLANATTVLFNTAPANGVAIRIYRRTNTDNLKATFFAGSAIRAQDLNDDFLQNNYAVQEIQNNTWDKETQTIHSDETWVSSDTQIATTAAMDARFQDEAAETITSAEGWPDNDDTIATTAAIDNRIDSKIDAAITGDIATDGTGITVTNDGDGTITLGLGANSIDFDRIKDVDIITQAEQNAGSPSPADTNLFTASAAARRFDTIVQTTTPTGSNWEVGKTWLQNDANLTLSVWNGSAWLGLASGGTFTNQPKVVYVDATAGDDNNEGHRISRPKATIKAAIQQINSDSTYGDGSVVVVAPGVYQEVAPIDIQKANVSIVGTALRSCIVHPTPATETNVLFRVNSGSYLQNLTFTGMKASGALGNTVDADLPVNQGWNVAFYPGATITKSPYIQNCTNFSDSEIDNSNLNVITPAGGAAGDTDSAPTGGGLLVDGSVVNSASPLRSMVCDSYTHVGLNGPGILVTNNGYAQCTSSYAFFNKYHIKCLNGGQANLAASTTDFGDQALVADGKSTSAIFTAALSTSANSGDITFTINAPTAGASWHGSATRPQGNMLVVLNGITYPILSATANGSGWNVTISRPNPTNRSENLGLNGAVSTPATASFYLRSMIASSGHTMEYVGSGTNYLALPENGGVPDNTKQIVELNNGKVWTAITDQNGKFKVGDFFEVDQQLGFVTIPSGSIAFDLASDLSPQLGANLDVLSRTISSSTGNVRIDDTLEVNAGTAAAPAVTFNGDTNTGLYSPGADQVAISTGGSGRLFINSTGNVGIGAANTGAAFLEVGGSLRWQTQGIFRNSTNTSTLLRFAEIGSRDVRLDTWDGTDFNGTIRHGAQTYLVETGTGASLTERLRITSAGLVGVGTSSPGYQLEVGSGATDATALFNSTAATGSHIRFGRSGTVDGYFGCATGFLTSGTAAGDIGIRSQGALVLGSGGNNNRIFIASAGNVGIGTSSPNTAARAHIVSSGTGTGVGDNVALRLASNGSGYSSTLAFSNEVDASYGISLVGSSLTFNSGVTTERMRLDSSGRLGIGSTPAAKLDIKMSGATRTDGVIIRRSTNDNHQIGLWTTGGDMYFDAITDNAAAAGQAVFRRSLDSGSTFNESARIDSAGRWLLGTSTSPSAGGQAQYARLVSKGNTTGSGGAGILNLGTAVSATSMGSNDGVGFISFSDLAGNEFATIGALVDGTISSTSDLPGKLVFSTTADGASSPTERMRISNVGEISTYSTDNNLNLRNSQAAGTTYNFIAGFYGASSTTSGGTVSFVVRNNGDVRNTNGTYSTVSDLKLKENVVDAASQWDDIKAIQIRNWNFKKETGYETHRQIGPIAQELEAVCPKLVIESADIDDEGNDLGTVTKSVNQSVLYMKAVKALQEAMERIEQLEAKVAALEAA